MASKSGRRRSQPTPAATPVARQWRRMDLHLHTPASNDYQEPRASYLDILRQAEGRGLDVIAFVDHNTVAGYAAMQKEIEELSLLERLGRLELEEKRRLDEYRRLLGRVLVLPGFEFTATFGFHIIGLFPPSTPLNFLEHLLLTLNVPKELLSKGSSTVGATSDALVAYEVINDAGGLVIAAHANTGNGVIMRGLDFGGQTRIAYTQDPNLHCLEVTDLDRRGPHTTRRFFDGSKPEYPRPMRCIQGSDAHRLARESLYAKQLGVGDRVTEIYLEEVSFEALARVLKGNDFSLTRPFHGRETPLDFVQAAREEGVSIVQAFHAGLTQRGGHLSRILEDVAAMANTNGGTIYIGVSADPKEKPVGVRDAEKASESLQATIAQRFSPTPDVTIDRLTSQGQTVVRVVVEPGRDTPYALDDNHFYVRDEAETTLAVRDEIVSLVERRLQMTAPHPEVEGGRVSTVTPLPAPAAPPASAVRPQPQPVPVSRPSAPAPPRTGVEIVNSEQRQGTLYHTLRDLRNGSLIKNVTRSSARKLWHYAITQAESSFNPREIKWQGNMAVIRARRKDDHVWYDLALRENGEIHLYYGVTDDGLNDEWLALIEKESGE